MGNIENTIFTYSIKATGSKGNYLANINSTDITHTLDTGLHYFAEATCFFSNTINIFVIINLLNTFGGVVKIFYNRKGYVGLKRKKSAVGIGKGNTITANEEILVTSVKVIFLELAHFKGFITVLRIKRTKLEYYFFRIA